MKSLFLALAATVASAVASITIVTPWANTTWVSGGQGSITWTSAANDTGSCEIQLMNGNASNANMVAYVTSPGAPINCTTNAFNIYPLNDFASGQYWIRIGERISKSWVYSGVFTFQGNATAKPLQSASSFDNTVATSSSGTSVANGAVPVATSAAASTSNSGVAAAASSQSDHSSDASSHLHAKTAIVVVIGAVVLVTTLAL